MKYIKEQKLKLQLDFAYKSLYISSQYLCQWWARHKLRIIDRKIHMVGTSQKKQVFYFYWGLL